MTFSIRMTAASFALLVLLAAPVFAFQVGEEAAPFSLKNVAGKTVSLSDFRGKLVVLDLGTTWCPGCRFQNKELARIDALFDDDQVQVLEVFMQETAETVRGYFKELGLSDRQALLDDGSVQRGYNVYLIPRLLIIDADGKVRFDAGMTESSVIEHRLRELLTK